MYYPHFSSVVDPGDIAITYSKRSASVINIASLVDHVIIKRSVSDSKVKSGYMIRSLSRILTKQEKKPIGMTLYMRYFDLKSIKPIFFNIGVYNEEYYKKHFVLTSEYEQ